MEDRPFYIAPEVLAATLAELLRHQNEPELAELVRTATATIDEVGYDRWDGGQWSYGVTLSVPLTLFAKVQPRLQQVEQALLEKLTTIVQRSNQHLQELQIVPQPSQAERAVAPRSSTVRLWGEEWRLRLFLSHVSAHKIAVQQLSVELGTFGVSAFVAHADIEMGLEWQQEIITALASMDAFVALLTNDFHRSDWTDQEIGYAVARGVPIIPVGMPINPYGFIGKIQAGIGDLATPHALADNLVDRLLTHGHTETAMRDALVRALAGAQTYRASRATSKKLVRFGAQLTREQLHILNTAMKTNSQIHHLGDVTSLLKPMIDRLPPEETGGAFDDDEIPF